MPALTVSPSSAESLRRHHRWRDVTVVPEGWSPHPVPEAAKEQRPTVVFLGRLVAMKRPGDAIAAFRIVAGQLPEAQLWMIGDGPLAQRLRPSAPAGVSFLGRVDPDELPTRLARAHVLVATSVREGWGLNVSEAAACGTPAVGYSVPGLVDSIPASGGLLVDPAPDALGQALVRFLRGEVELEPRVSTLPWREVAEVIERRLDEVVRAFRNAAG